MPSTTDPDARTAGAPAGARTGPVTLINKFEVDPARDEAFHELWHRTSRYFREQPGFVRLRLHRAVSPDAAYRWVNVAQWESLERFQAAHDTDEFRRLVSLEAWREFPSSPALYEVVFEHAAAEAA
jgi:heme oxygenase (mycobilin-producing)